MFTSFFLLSLAAGCFSSHVYHTFNATELTPEQYDLYAKQGATEFCTITVADCDEAEHRRIDGTCNNLKQKSRGGTRTPLRRWLAASYDKVAEIRKAKSGKPLPNPRVVRTNMLFNGRVSNNKFTTLVTNKLQFMISDVLQPPDAEYFISTAPSCCSKEGQNNERCRRIPIPNDDPVLRFSCHRCMNYTIPQTYQSTGCNANGTSPEVTNQATPAYDLSHIYGIDNSLTKCRQLEKGMLKSEEVEGRIWPPQIEETKANSYCVQNKGYEKETRCHDTPNPASNENIGTNLFTIWYWRLHNHIAKQLSALNPCWDDNKIFFVARDINIALSQQIYFYELLTTLFGQEILIKDEIISSNAAGFRDVYDESLFPQITYEYAFSLRWIHTIQEGMLKLYDAEGTYLKSFPAVNMTYRTGHLAVGDNIDLFTQGSFRQSCADVDNVIDPDFAERAYGEIQEITDITAVDIMKGRDMGMQPYVAYRQRCGGENVSSWEELKQVLNSGQAERLQTLYEDVEDIDLIVGMWAEKPMNGSTFPQTFYSLIAEHLKNYVKSDRHWFEREKRPNAFTAEQLAVIRKATVASILCTVGDKVTKIQPNAFLKAGTGNEMKACNEIPQLDFNPWKFECPKPTTEAPAKKKKGNPIKKAIKKAWKKITSIF